MFKLPRGNLETLACVWKRWHSKTQLFTTPERGAETCQKAILRTGLRKHPEGCSIGMYVFHFKSTVHVWQHPTSLRLDTLAPSETFVSLPRGQPSGAPGSTTRLHAYPWQNSSDEKRREPMMARVWMGRFVPISIVLQPKTNLARHVLIQNMSIHII